MKPLDYAAETRRLNEAIRQHETMRWVLATATWPERLRYSFLIAGTVNWILNLVLIYTTTGSGLFQLVMMLAWSVAIGVGVVGWLRWRVRMRVGALMVAVGTED